MTRYLVCYLRMGVLTFLVLSCVVSIFLLMWAESAGATVTWAHEEIYIEADIDDVQLTGEFPFSNNQNFPWAILSVKPRFGVIDATIHRDGPNPNSISFHPGDEATLVATVDIGSIWGQVTREVTVKTDHNDELFDPITDLLIHINVPVPLNIDTNNLEWGPYEASATKYVTVTATTERDVTVESVSTSIYPVFPEDSFDFDIQTILEGREYRVAITPTQRDLSTFGRYVIETDLPEQKPDFTLRIKSSPLILDGDFSGDGFVSQADLDLILLNWGSALSPDGFDARALPVVREFDGLISQNELDVVLLNWGDDRLDSPNILIPEPGSIAFLAIVFAWMAKWQRVVIG